MRNLILAMILSSVATISTAQEVPSPRPMLIGGAMLCDTKQDLEMLLTEISLNRGQFPEELPETCGFFKPEQPVQMLVSPSYWYETPLANTLIAHLLYIPNGWKQWGYIAYIANPDYNADDPA